MTKSNKRGKGPPDDEERKKRVRKSDKIAPKKPKKQSSKE